MTTTTAAMTTTTTDLEIASIIAQMEADMANEVVEATHSIKPSYMENEWIVSAKTREGLNAALAQYKAQGARLARAIVAPNPKVRKEFQCWQAYVVSKVDLV